MMKKIFLIMMLFSTVGFSQNVYFSEPTSTHVDTIYSSGSGPVNYSMYVSRSLYVPNETNYRARLRYPDGTWSSWQIGKNGGWWVTQPGTYMIEGKVWAYNVVLQTDYKWYYRDPFSFSVIAIPPPQPLTSVSIFGDYFLYLGSTGYWNATLTNGIAPFTYNWQIMYLGSISSLSLENKSSASTNKIGSGEIIINAPPSDSWISTYVNAPTFSRTNDGLDPRDFKLRCIVTDASNTTKVSNEFYVDILSEYPPQMSIVQNNSDVQKASLAIESSFESVPTEYSLKQNYPNPFNPSTTIEYQLPLDGFVSLKIFDLLGSEVKTLVNEFKAKGRYSITFDASSLTSGLYIYQLKSNNFNSVKKMILSK